MLIAANAQAQATFQAAPPQYLAAVCGGHALAEAVHSHTAPDLGLISTLGHLLTPNKRITAFCIDWELLIIKLRVIPAIKVHISAQFCEKHQTAVSPPGF
jgi:hypothetical protein